MTDPESVRAAVAEVRREGQKAAALTGTADGVLAALAANLALSVAAVSLGALPAVPIDAGSAVALAVGLAVGLGSGWLRARRHGVERLESTDPDLGVAVRSARDAAAEGRDDPMARRLYEDALDRLSAASSRELLDERRLLARTVLVLVLAPLTIHAAAAGVALDPLAGAGSVAGPVGPSDSGSGGGAAPDAAETPTPAGAGGGLASGEEILGESQNVTGGSELLSANVSSGPGGSADGDAPASFPDAGGAGADPRRAGYEGGTEVADADLVREYAIRVNEEEDTDE